MSLVCLDKFYEKLSLVFLKDTVFQIFITSLIGLIPNCSSSILLTELYLKDIILGQDTNEYFTISVDENKISIDYTPLMKQFNPDIKKYKVNIQINEIEWKRWNNEKWWKERHESTTSLWNNCYDFDNHLRIFPWAIFRFTKKIIKKCWQMSKYILQCSCLDR